jgi:hypothetical protein
MRRESKGEGRVVCNLWSRIFAREHPLVWSKEDLGNKFYLGMNGVWNSSLDSGRPTAGFSKYNLIMSPILWQRDYMLALCTSELEILFMIDTKLWRPVWIVLLSSRGICLKSKETKVNCRKYCYMLVQANKDGFTLVVPTVPLFCIHGVEGCICEAVSIYAM